MHMKYHENYIAGLQLIYFQPLWMQRSSLSGLPRVSEAPLRGSIADWASEIGRKCSPNFTNPPVTLRNNAKRCNWALFVKHAVPEVFVGVGVKPLRKFGVVKPRVKSLELSISLSITGELKDRVQVVSQLFTQSRLRPWCHWCPTMIHLSIWYNIDYMYIYIYIL